jgi:hypothetical protein
MRKYKLPHLVATIDGAVAGYAYAVLFRKRPFSASWEGEALSCCNQPHGALDRQLRAPVS